LLLLKHEFWLPCAHASVSQVDVQGGTTQLWQAPGHYPGEPIFVARPGARQEDDGILLVVVLDGEWQSGAWRGLPLHYDFVGNLCIHSLLYS
jgi:carotenoid cleavage dioxygenase-like enzyme